MRTYLKWNLAYDKREVGTNLHIILLVFKTKLKTI